LQEKVSAAFPYTSLPAATPCESPASNDKGERSSKHPAKNQEQFFDQPKDESECRPDNPNYEFEKQQGYHQ